MRDRGLGLRLRVVSRAGGPLCGAGRVGMGLQFGRRDGPLRAGDHSGDAAARGAGEAPEVGGLLHPVARVSGRGRSLRRRCFVGCGMRMVLPAFGAYTGGLDIRDAAFGGLWNRHADVRAFLLGRDQVYAFGAGRVAT